MGGEDGGEVEKKGRRKFAVLLCADDSEYVKKTYGGYFKVFVGLLGEEGEAWDLYRAAHGELPCMADVDGYDGFVITGSCNDAHGDDQWINDLVSFLKALDSLKKKVLGVCFGHQVYPLLLSSAYLLSVKLPHSGSRQYLEHAENMILEIFLVAISFREMRE